MPFDIRVQSLCNEFWPAVPGRKSAQMAQAHRGADAREIVVDRAAIDEEPFVKDGGFQRLNKIFGGQLEAVLATSTKNYGRKQRDQRQRHHPRDRREALEPLQRPARRRHHVHRLRHGADVSPVPQDAAETGHEERLPKAIAGTSSPSAKGSTSSSTTGSCCSISAIRRRPRMRVVLRHLH